MWHHDQDSSPGVSENRSHFYEKKKTGRDSFQSFGFRNREKKLFIGDLILEKLNFWIWMLLELSSLAARFVSTRAGLEPIGLDFTGLNKIG